MPVYDNRYIKTTIRKYGDKVCTNFPGLNVPEDCVNVNLLKSFLLILVYENKCYLWVYLGNCHTIKHTNGRFS